MIKILYVVVAASALTITGCANDQSAGKGSTGAAQAKADAKPMTSMKPIGTTPTVAEVNAAYTGYITRTKSPRGAPVKIMWLADGVLKTEVDIPRETLYRTGTWWVKPDSSMCTKIERANGVSERCSKMIKVSNKIYPLDSKGERFGNGAPVKK